MPIIQAPQHLRYAKARPGKFAAVISLVTNKHGHDPDHILVITNILVVTNKDHFT